MANEGWMRSRGQTHCILPTVALPHDGWHTETQGPHIHMILLKVYVCTCLYVWYVKSGCKTYILIWNGLFGISVIALYVYKWVSFMYQVIHFIWLYTTDISWFPFITTLHTVTLEVVISCSIFSLKPFCSTLNPLSQITSKNSLPWRTVGHHTPSVILNPTVSCSVDPSHTFKHHATFSYRRCMKPHINPTTYG